MRENVFDVLENSVKTSSATEAEKAKMYRNLLNLKNQKLNIMITGATGCGKSSTINAMFDTSVAKVGEGVDPETMEIRSYQLDGLTLWDTPGLGDGKEADNHHAEAITKKLSEMDAEGRALIDLVLVILDGSSRDLGTSYELINQVIIPCLGENAKDRILVAVNQADLAMKGRNWDPEKNKPNETLQAFLDQKAASVRKRILEGTGVEVEPVCYSAGYSEGGIQQRPWNLSKLLYYIVEKTPVEKRVIYVNNTNQNQEMWKDDDHLIDYREETKKSILHSIVEGAVSGAEIGGEIGGLLGKPGKVVGKIVGGVIGGFAGAISHLLGF